MQVQQEERNRAEPAVLPRSVPVSVGITLAGLVFVGALASLTGWILDIPRLIDWEGAGITIKANASICLVLSALALLIGLIFPRQKTLVRCLGAIVGAVGALTLLEHAFGVNFGIDTLFFREAPGALATSAPGRMGIPGSTCFLFLGIALILKKGAPAHRRIASGLGLAVIAISFLSLTGYLFRADLLYSIPKTTGIAMQTAAMLCLLGLGLVAAIPEAGLAAAMYRLDAGGVVLRRLVLPTLVIPILLGWVSVQGQKAGLYDVGFGSSVHTVFEILVLVGLVWWTSAGISRVAETVEASRRSLEGSEARYRIIAEDLRTREAQLRAVVQSLQEGVVVADRSGYLLEWNSAALRMHGFGEGDGRAQFEEIAAQFQLFHLSGEEIPLEDWPVPRLLRGDSFAAWEIRVVKRDGSMDAIFSYGGAPVYDGDEIVLIVVTMQEVTERIQARQQLEAREKLLRTVTDHAHVGLVIVDAERRYRYANRAYADVLGLTGHDLIGKQVREVLPEQFESHIEPNLELAFGGREVQYELTIPDPRESSGARCVEVRYQPQGSGGTVDAVIVSVIDVTPSKRLNETLEQMVRERTDELSAANEQLQGFTYSVAHDLRQQIRGINVNASMLMMDAADDLSAENKDLLQRMSNSAVKLAALVDDLLTYARLGQQEPKLERVDLTSMFEEAADAIIDDGYCCKDSFEIQKGMVARGDPAMLRIVVQNLLDNAVKYSRNAQPSPRIEVGEQDGAFFVRDNGIGFDMRFVDKLFKPFERLHRDEEFAGTGIGLANVRRIVRKHGGSVWAEGKPGKGATFFFALTGKS